MNEQRCRGIVYERSGGICEISLDGICLRRASNISHRIARSQGGGWNPSNTVHSCGSGTLGCHGYIEAHPIEARKRGHRLSNSEDPALVPLVMRTATLLPAWWLLADDGTLTWVESLEVRPV